MKNRKLKKYLKQVVAPFESTDFILLFSNSSLLGYANTTLEGTDYQVLKKTLEHSLQMIESHDEFRELISSDDGYLFPYGEYWIRLNVNNQKPVGLTYYLDTTYKLFLFEHEQKVAISNVSTNYVRGSQMITENLQLA